MSRSPHPSPKPPRYRVWDGKMMHTVCGLVWHSGYMYWRGALIGDGQISLNAAIPIINKDGSIHVLMQRTGVKDKTGLPIYEGDILRFAINGITHGPEREEGIIGEVWYCAEDAGWAIGHWTEHRDPPFNTYSWWYSFTDRLDMSTIEVIGNVHENPQLLT